MTLEHRQDYVNGQSFIQLEKSHAAKVRRDVVSVAKIWTECFGEPIVKLSYSENRSIQLILKKLGWVRAEKKRRDTTGQVRICYLRPETSPDEGDAEKERASIMERCIPVPKPDDCPF